MDITVVGLGYVGAVAVAALSKAGHNVLGVDVDQGKVSSLRQGICPFYEPELSELISSGLAAGRLKFHRLEEVRKSLGEISSERLEGILKRLRDHLEQEIVGHE